MDQNEDNNLNNQQEINQTEQSQQLENQNQQQFVEQNQQQGEQSQEKVVEQSKQQGQKQKFTRKKKIVSVVASLLVIFLATNCFAAALGYNNIFFVIRNLIKHQDVFVSGKDNIFTDRDITISYEPIQITNGVFIQINQFIAKDNEATLRVTYQQMEEHDNLSDIIVTDEQDNQIGSVDVSTFASEGYDVENLSIKLSGYKANMNILHVKAMYEGKEVSKIKVDLETRTIDVLSNGASYELTKLSETELKEVLGQYVMINYYDDVISARGNYVVPEESYIMAFMTDMATSKYDNINVNNISKILNEIYGRDENTPVQLDARISDIAKLDPTTNRFIGRSNNDYPYGFCINVSDIKFENGVYTVTFAYCYLAEDGDMMSNKIARADIYETTFNFKINDNFQYFRYQIQNINSITSQKAKEGNYKEIIELEENNYGPGYTIPQTPTPTPHTHSWRIDQSTLWANGPRITLGGSHPEICDCGARQTDLHHFVGKWYSLNSDPSTYDAAHINAWTLTCEKCHGYVYTTDYDVVRNSRREYDPIRPVDNLEEKVKGEWRPIKATRNVDNEELNPGNTPLTFLENGEFIFMPSIGNIGEKYYSDGYVIYFEHKVNGNTIKHHVYYDERSDRLYNNHYEAVTYEYERVK